VLHLAAKPKIPTDDPNNRPGISHEILMFMTVRFSRLFASKIGIWWSAAKIDMQHTADHCLEHEMSKLELKTLAVFWQIVLEVRRV
jgi:hypothetical protein